MQAFEYANPATVQEAVGLLGNNWEDANLLAGGTDLLSLMKDYIHTPKRVVSLKGIKELEGIRKSEAGLRIGALVTLEELLRNADVRKEYPSLAAAARGVASPQMRNMGTVGGDLCQRPRCWYFRLGFGLFAKGPNGESLVPNGDNRYHAIFNNRGPAYFVSASSFGPPLVALGATVNLVSPSGTRELPIEKFFVTPESENARENVLAPNEILTEILVPPAAGVRNATYEVRQKTALDFPLATASVALRMQGSRVASARIVLGHVAPAPWHAAAAEKVLTGKALDDTAIEQAANAAVEGATPLSMNAYKVQLARVAVKRALQEAAKART
ncbi:MAG: FAD binding domain-containing protein [Rhodospirillales bacterium]